MQKEHLLIGRACAALKLRSVAVALWALALPAASQPAMSQPVMSQPVMPQPVAPQSSESTAAQSSTSMTAAELSLLDAINDYRRTQGRTAWAAEPGLAAVARAHSHAMAQRGRFSHDGFAQRAEGTASALCVENLLQGTVSPARAVRSWTASGAHRDNLLEPGARFAGIGMAGRFVTMLACASPPAKPAMPVGEDTAPLQADLR